MHETILVGREGQLMHIPRQAWEQHLAAVPQVQKARLQFMTTVHHRVRNFVVKMLPRLATAITPAYIAQHVGLPLDEIQVALEELEAQLFFLVRNDHRAVAWAFPVTVDPTPHRLIFHTGEQLYAA
jgi:hypothetical protein